MQIELSPQDEQLLVQWAADAGYDGPEQFVSAHILRLIRESETVPPAPLHPEQLQASLQMLEESEADIAAGRTQDAREALQEIADRHSLSIDGSN